MRFVIFVLCEATECVNNTDGPVLIKIGLVFDHWASEVSWEIVDSVDSSVVASDSGYSNNAGSASYSGCIPESCYYFRIYDSYGDGICCANNYGEGNYRVWVNGNSVTWENKQQTFHQDSDEIFFCTQFLVIIIQILNTII